jgi:hypothetical protein
MAHHCTVTERTTIAVRFSHTNGNTLERRLEWEVDCDKCGTITKRYTKRDAQVSANRHEERPLGYKFG